MNISLATSDNEITACYPVLHELRPHMTEEGFVAQIRRQQEQGYQLAYLQADRRVVAVAGFRLGENLAWGRFLYVDDLVTHPGHRSRGYGSQLLAWLRRYARREGCGQLHLDSGVQREDAHRFYLREGMAKASYHFVERLSTD